MIKEERGKLLRVVTKRVSMSDLHWQMLLWPKGGQEEWTAKSRSSCTGAGKLN